MTSTPASATANDAASLADARRRDVADALAGFSDQFHHPSHAGRRATYLCGHSLGLAPRAAAGLVDEELDDWARLAVLGHEQAHRPWISYHRALQQPLAALVGADAQEVVAMNSLTVNLHLMMTSFFRPAGERVSILMESGAFGSDRYAVVSQLRLHGLSEAEHLIELQPRAGERCLRQDDILAAVQHHARRLALVLLPGVQYLTGQLFDLAPLIAAARRIGAAVGLDLAHAIGNVPLQLHDWDADFAVWCSYKYLNAGPGAIGGCFVHARHAQRFDLPRLAGWWGHDPHTRFEMGPDFRPTPGAQGWQLSNPPILATAPLIASLRLFAEAGLPALRRKSIELTGWLEGELRAQLGSHVDIITPADPAQRGCQLSLRLRAGAERARAIFQRMQSAGVIADWREPDIIRLAPVPLYNSFADCHAAVQALRAALSA